jgi:hypothetical protein
MAQAHGLHRARRRADVAGVRGVAKHDPNVIHHIQANFLSADYADSTDFQINTDKFRQRTKLGLIGLICANLRNLQTTVFLRVYTKRDSN